MLSFELSAIDIILVISVLVLFILYWTKLSAIPEENILRRPITQRLRRKKIAQTPRNGYAECPRGFGYIKKIGTNGSVSDRCSGCYRFMDCYGESKVVNLKPNQSGRQG